MANFGLDRSIEVQGDVGKLRVFSDEVALSGQMIQPKERTIAGEKSTKAEDLNKLWVFEILWHSQDLWLGQARNWVGSIFHHCDGRKVHLMSSCGRK